MRNIHQLFVKDDQPQVRRATIESGRKSLCWYPSAGTDFRHIRMLEEEGLSELAASPPLVYLHNDVMLPQICGDSFGHRVWASIEPSSGEGVIRRRPFHPRFCSSDVEIGPKMRIANITAIHPKKPPRQVSNEVCSCPANENTGRAFLLEVEIHTAHRGRCISIPVPVLYFIAENLNFLVQVLLAYRLRVHTLVHIRDGGGSLGGSQIPMNFIYQAAPLLGIKRVICDASPETKHFNTEIDFEVLECQMRWCGTLDARGPAHRSHHRLRELSEDEIRASWEGRRIDRARMPANEFSPPDGYYYDWRRRPSRTSVQDFAPNTGPRVG